MHKLILTIKHCDWKNLGVLYFITAFVLLAEPLLLSAQEQPPAKEQVRNTFEYCSVINNQTVECLSNKTLDFTIEHRFGQIVNGNDLYGIFAISNARIGLDYGLTNRLTAGIGAQSHGDFVLYDLQAKYILLSQEKPGGIPFTLTYYVNAALAAGPNENFLNQEGIYSATGRFSYFDELMIARKFNNRFSLQAGVTYSHYNLTDSSEIQSRDHDFFNAALVARYKFSPQSSIIADCNVPFKKRTLVTTNDDGSITTESLPKINLGLGVEISTGSHQFQVFLCTADGILNQDIAVYNAVDISNKGILLGFNIIRQWGFK